MLAFLAPMPSAILLSGVDGFQLGYAVPAELFAAGECTGCAEPLVDVYFL